MIVWSFTMDAVSNFWGRACLKNVPTLSTETGESAPQPSTCTTTWCMLSSWVSYDNNKTQLVPVLILLETQIAIRTIRGWSFDACVRAKSNQNELMRKKWVEKLMGWMGGMDKWMGWDGWDAIGWKDGMDEWMVWDGIAWDGMDEMGWDGMGWMDNTLFWKVVSAHWLTTHIQSPPVTLLRNVQERYGGTSQ